MSIKSNNMSDNDNDNSIIMDICKGFSSLSCSKDNVCSRINSINRINSFNRSNLNSGSNSRSNSRSKYRSELELEYGSESDSDSESETEVKSIKSKKYDPDDSETDDNFDKNCFWPYSDSNTSDDEREESDWQSYIEYHQNH
jgi:hypothetical protein